MQVVVCGAGIIGASVAYHLALRGVPALLVEREAVACAASGKAGGFLALDWCDGSALAPLARSSFEMHARLAAELGPDCGYRRVETLAVAAVGRAVRLEGGAPAPAWVDGACATFRHLGDTRSTAQVHPARLTRALVDAARDRGARLRIGTVESIELAGGPRPAVRGVRVDGEAVAADAVVVALGPWSGCLGESLPLPRIHAIMGQSLLLRPRSPVPAEALFVEYHDDEGQTHSPEIYPRPDGHVYVSGLAEDGPLPADPAAVRPSAARIEALRRFAADFSSVLGEAEEVTAQACFRPIVRDGLPLLGPVPGVDGAFVATGHSCWGILNAPASGAALAARIVEAQAPGLDLAAYDPARPALAVDAG